MTHYTPLYVTWYKTLLLYFCISAPPELYTDATKHLASHFISKQEAVVTEPITTFTLAPNNCAFAIADSTLKLTKFRLPQANENVWAKQCDLACSLLVSYLGFETSILLL